MFNFFILQDKIRYEVAVGLFKSSDELIEQYVDLVKKFPRVVMIIDPFHPSVSQTRTHSISHKYFNTKISRTKFLGTNFMHEYPTPV